MAENNQVVVLIHGIRTDAGWAERVKKVLVAETGVVVETLRYEWFNVFRFLCPVFTRTGPVREIEKKLRTIEFYNNDKEISIVAHSFGAYIVATILKNNDFFRAKRIILCGSVVHREFNWTGVAHKIKDPKVLNDCGSKDVFPILAANTTFGYGATGTFGFGHPNVHDRFHERTHSGFFDEEFVRDYWAPYISNGTIRSTVWEQVVDKRSP